MHLHGGNGINHFDAESRAAFETFGKYNPESGINNWNDSIGVYYAGEGRQV